MKKIVKLNETQLKRIISNVIKEGEAYMLDGDDEKGVRGPLTILKYAIMQQDWEMVKQASDELESYVNSKFSQPEDDEDDEPSDDEIYNGFGREGGIGYDTGDSWQGR